MKQVLVYPSYEEFAILMNAFTAPEIADMYKIKIASLYKWYERGGDESRKYREKEQREEHEKRVTETLARMDAINPNFRKEHKEYLKSIGR